VLAGAPAAVAAIERRATATLIPSDGYCRYSSRGYLAPSIALASPIPPDVAVARITSEIARFWGYDRFEKPFSLSSDSRAFFAHGTKLGIGSSAAMTVATYAALAKFSNRTMVLDEALAIHRAMQGSGSGLDIATSWHGGITKFQDGQVVAQIDLSHLAWQVVWTGESASTHAHIGDFNRWRDQQDSTALNDLARASSALFSTPTIAALIEYSDCLRTLDLQAKLNIYTQAHLSLATIARDLEVAYKPCGAGGGDIGMAFSQDQDALDEFRDAAKTLGFACPKMEIANDGVREE